VPVSQEKHNYSNGQFATVNSHVTKVLVWLQFLSIATVLPLASLAVLNKRSLPISIRKSALTEAQLQEIDSVRMRPTWVLQAIMSHSTGYDLSVWGLYWGVFHMIGQLAKDTSQMQDAERRLQDIQLA